LREPLLKGNDPREAGLQIVERNELADHLLPELAELVRPAAQVVAPSRPPGLRTYTKLAMAVR
jgi:hypothetical protein